METQPSQQTWKPKWQRAKKKLMDAIHPSQGDLIDCIRVKINEDRYLTEVAIGTQSNNGQEYKMLKMSEQELESHKLICQDGALFYAIYPTKIASTVGLKSKMMNDSQAFVMGKDGSIYIASHTGGSESKNGLLSHASFLNGRPAELAGLISIDAKGKINKLSTNSGHYAPEPLDMYRGIKALQQNMPGVFADNCQIRLYGKESSLNDFITEMEIINPETNKMHHEELREARIKVFENQKLRLSQISQEALNTQLMSAVASDRIDVIQNLVSKGADINTSDENGLTVLHYAAFNNHPDIVEMFITKGANINAQDNQGFTALHYVVSEGYIEMMEMLVTKGANIDIKTKEGQSVSDMIGDDNVLMREAFADAQAKRDITIAANKRHSPTELSSNHIAAVHTANGPLYSAQSKDLNLLNRSKIG